jgi:hypothetical protein
MSSGQTISEDISKVLARYAPTQLGADLSNFTKNEKAAIGKLVTVGRLIDRFVKHFFALYFESINTISCLNL